MERYIPSAESNYKTAKITWHGINRKVTEDSGYMSEAVNISTEKLPYSIPAPIPDSVKDGYENPISIHGFDDFLLVIYRDSAAIKADYITSDGTVYTGTIKSSGATEADEYPRSVVQFNVYTTPNDPLGGTYDKKLLIFPDRLSMDFIVSANFTPANINTESNPVPAIKYASVHLSRLFGVDAGRVYASGFNDYSMWNLDTADESLASNAWCTAAQSNTKAGNDFTAIITYDNHVVCFKRDFMQQVYNTKNPFRIVDITQIGAINNDCIAEVGGILYFASSDAVYAYSGGYPSKISDTLCISDFTGCFAAGYDGTYYIYSPSDETVYTFDTVSKEWGARSVGEILYMTSNDSGIYVLTSAGEVKKLNTSAYGTWNFITDVMMNQTLITRRIKKISLYCEIPASGYIKIDAYDDKGELHNVIDSGTLTGKRVLRACVRMTSAYGHKLKIYGSGKVIVKELELYTSYGGDTYVSE